MRARAAPAGVHEGDDRAVVKGEFELEKAGGPLRVLLDLDVLGRAVALDGEVARHAKVEEDVGAVTRELKPEVLAFPFDMIYGSIEQRGLGLGDGGVLEDLCRGGLR